MNSKIIFEFSKEKDMRFISHLDLMRLFMRAFRRANIPIKFSEGFSPHPKLSLKRALKLGLESHGEEAKVALSGWIELSDFQNKLQQQLPEGLRITHVKRDFN